MSRPRFPRIAPSRRSNLLLRRLPRLPKKHDSSACVSQLRYRSCPSSSQCVIEATLFPSSRCLRGEGESLNCLCGDSNREGRSSFGTTGSWRVSQRPRASWRRLFERLRARLPPRLSGLRVRRSENSRERLRLLRGGKDPGLWEDTEAKLLTTGKGPRMLDENGGGLRRRVLLGAAILRRSLFSFQDSCLGALPQSL